MQENRQRLRGAQKKDGIDFRNIYALVVDVHDEDEPHLAGHQAPLGRRSFLARRLPGEAHGRDVVVVKIAAHKLRVIDRHAEAEALHLVNVRHIFQQCRHHMVGATVGNGTAEGVDLFQLALLIATGRPFQRIQIYGIGDTKILERAE